MGMSELSLNPALFLQVIALPLHEEDKSGILHCKSKTVLTR